MEGKGLRLSVNDRLGIVAALIKTADLAIGNVDYFGRDGQGVAITLGIAGEKLDECRKLLISPNGNGESAPYPTL